jgi:hypothetical protein
MRRALLLVASTVVFAVGCSPSGSSVRSLSGQLDTTQVHLVQAQVVAQAIDGRVFRAPVSSTGAFQLTLPVGVRYSVRFANTTSNSSLYDSFAVLAVRPGQHTFDWTAGGAVALGRVGRAAAAASALQPASETEDGTGTSGSDDGKESDVEDDGAKACDLSNGADEMEVQSAHDLLADVDSDHDGKSDAVDTEDDRPACAATASKDDDRCSHGDDEKEMDDEHAKACSSMNAGGTTNMTPPVPGVIVP